MVHTRHPAPTAKVNAMLNQKRMGWVEREIQKNGKTPRRNATMMETAAAKTMTGGIACDFWLSYIEPSPAFDNANAFRP
jgi:hypothetical protein